MEENLVLTGYGVTLRRLTHDKIEMLRQWRNDPKIQKYMLYRETISPEMQERWWQNINNENNYYFIIEYNGKEVGCTNIKDVDYEKKCGEPGIFIYDEEYLNSDVPMRASFCLGDFIWNTLHLDYQYIHVLKNNFRAIQYNKFFGYKLISGHDDDESQMYVLTHEDSIKNKPKTDRIKRALKLY